MSQSFDDFLSEKTETHVFKPATGPTKPIKTRSGHTVVGFTYYGPNKDLKGANIMKHGETGKFFAAGGSSSGATKYTTFHDTPEEAAEAYHAKKQGKAKE